MSCVRYLGMTNVNEINKLTLYEYDLLMSGILLKKLDEKANMHQQAWLNRQVNAEKKINKGKSEYVYKRYSDFFDFEKEFNSIFISDDTQDKYFESLVLKANSGGGK